jgi:hypothetical protein
MAPHSSLRLSMHPGEAGMSTSLTDGCHRAIRSPGLAFCNTKNWHNAKISRFDIIVNQNHVPVRGEGARLQFGTLLERHVLKRRERSTVFKTRFAQQLAVPLNVRRS